MKERFKNSIATLFFACYCASAVFALVSIYIALQQFLPTGSAAHDSGKFAILAIVLVVSILGLAIGAAGVWSLTARLRRIVAFARGMALDRMPRDGLEVVRQDELGALEATLNELTRNLTLHMQRIESESERIHSILGCMMEAVIVLDTRGQVVLLNQAARDMFGLPRGVSALRMSPMEISRHPEMHKLIRQVSGGDHVQEPMVREITLGNQRWFEVSATPLQNRQGAPVGNILVLHEVTELKRLEQMRVDFVANVSHEMRTPLTAIQGYAETLLHDPSARRKNAKPFLSVITHHSGRLGRLIDDLLTLSDLETGNVDLRMTRVAARPLVDDVLNLFEDHAHKGEITLGADVEPNTPDILGDADRLQQLLINLVDNAVKYTPAGGTVTVQSRSVPSSDGTDGRWVELAVSDTGCGIADKDLARLTERFYRVDKARSRELGGTGLGLAIVKHIVQVHGGKLGIESQLQKGTTIRIQLPAAPRDLAGDAGQRTLREDGTLPN